GKPRLTAWMVSCCKLPRQFENQFNQALSQLCAFASPFQTVLSDMEIYLQLTSDCIGFGLPTKSTPFFLFPHCCPRLDGARRYRTAQNSKWALSTTKLWVLPKRKNGKRDATLSNGNQLRPLRRQRSIPSWNCVTSEKK